MPIRLLAANACSRATLADSASRILLVRCDRRQLLRSRKRGSIERTHTRPGEAPRTRKSGRRDCIQVTMQGCAWPVDAVRWLHRAIKSSSWTWRTLLGWEEPSSCVSRCTPTGAVHLLGARRGSGVWAWNEPQFGQPKPMRTLQESSGYQRRPRKRASNDQRRWRCTHTGRQTRRQARGECAGEPRRAPRFLTRRRPTDQRQRGAATAATKGKAEGNR